MTGTPSLGVSIPTEGNAKDLNIFAGGQYAQVVAHPNLPLPSPDTTPPPTSEVDIGNNPVCSGLPSNVAFMLNTSSKLNGNIFRLTTGWSVGDGANGSQNITATYNLGSNERTIYPSLWSVVPAGPCTFYIQNSWLHGYLIPGDGNSVIHGTDNSLKGQWKIYSNKGSVGGYRLVSAYDGRFLHTGFDGDRGDFGPPVMVPADNPWDPKQALWIMNYSFSPPQ